MDMVLEKEDLLAIAEIVVEKLAPIQEDITVMQKDIDMLKGDVCKLSLSQENVVLPRLNTIESCYTDTYDRYRKYADKMDTAFSDIELLKNVVSQHSVMLKKLA